MIFCRILISLLTIVCLIPFVLADDIRDIKPPVDFPPNYFLLWMIAGIGIVSALLLLTRLILRKQWKKSAPPRLPHEIAIERLTELQKKNLPQSGNIKEFYSVLSDIIRRYIEGRFLIKAPEMTTPEFLWFLEGSDRLSPDHKEFLKDFLASCDMVKFAKYAPLSGEIDNSFQLAKKFVDETKEIARLPLEEKK